MTLHDALVKIGVGGVLALTIGGGSVLVNVNKDNAIQDQRIIVLERNIIKIEEMDKTLRAVDVKVDVLNQKLDDAKDQLLRRK